MNPQWHKAYIQLAFRIEKPFHMGVGIVEGYAKQLLGSHLQGADRWSVFRRLMTQQLYPSMLIYS